MVILMDAEPQVRKKEAIFCTHKEYDFTASGKKEKEATGTESDKNAFTLLTAAW